MVCRIAAANRHGCPIQERGVQNRDLLYPAGDVDLPKLCLRKLENESISEANLGN